MGTAARAIPQTSVPQKDPENTKANRYARHSVEATRLACTATGLSHELPVTLRSSAWKLGIPPIRDYGYTTRTGNIAVCSKRFILNMDERAASRTNRKT